MRRIHKGIIMDDNVTKELKYFESDRLKLTHDYGGDVADGRVESFHTMLRLKLSF